MSTRLDGLHAVLNLQAACKREGFCFCPRDGYIALAPSSDRHPRLNEMSMVLFATAEECIAFLDGYGKCVFYTKKEDRT